MASLWRRSPDLCLAITYYLNHLKRQCINNMLIVIAKQVTLRHQVCYHTIPPLHTCARVADIAENPRYAENKNSLCGEQNALCGEQKMLYCISSYACTNRGRIAANLYILKYFFPSDSIPFNFF